MSCPLCGYIYVCPCKYCVDRKDPTFLKWSRIDGDEEACPICGLTLSIDEWEGLEWENHKKIMGES